MITALWTIFYLWLVLSILLAAMWFLHRHDQLRDDQPEDDVLLPAMQEPLSEAAKRADAAAKKAEPEPAVGAKPPPDPKPQPEPDIPAEPEREPEPEPEQAKAAATGSTNGAANGSSKGGSATNGNGTATSIPPDEPTIEQLLDGITLPFGLARADECIVDSGSHAVYLSDHPNAEEVGTAFADQLVGLGYDIEPAGYDQALATRDGQVLSMRIAANAGADDDGNAARYPHADESDVAIEVWTGDGPAPSIRD